MVNQILTSDALLRGPESRTLSLGLIVPLSGVMGQAGPAIMNCALLATEEVAAATGRAIELIIIDGGQSPQAVAAEVELLVSSHLVHGLVGTHPSNVRAAVEQVLRGRVPYIFTPPHEGATAKPGSIFLGTSPSEQLKQPIAWLSAHRKISTWALIGNDYVWPRQVHRAARKALSELGQTVVMDRLVPTGNVDVEELAHTALKSGAEGILVSLIGRDSIEFNRTIVEIGAANHFVRLCSALDENCLVAAGGDETGNLYSAMPSFIRQDDDRHLQLMESYTARFGFQAPLPGTYAEGCYDGVNLLASLAVAGFAIPKKTLAERKTAAIAIALGTDLEPTETFSRV